MTSSASQVHATRGRTLSALRTSISLALAMVVLAPRALAYQFTLQWTDNSTNETQFKIERALGAGAFAQIATVGTNVVSYVDAGLPASTTYRYRVRAANSAGNSGYSNIATGTTLASSPANTAPTISAIVDRTISEDVGTGAIAFTVGDTQTAAASLTLTRASSNTTLVPTANIVFGGSGASRTVTVTPAANRSGTATITATVSDGSLTKSDSFVVTVASVNDAPTISNIVDRTLVPGTNTGAIAFTVGDVETAAASLTLTRTSSNTTLIPVANIVLGGSGASRTVTASPVAGQTGSATLTVSVSDGARTASDTFVVSVGAANTAPTISSIASRTINEDASSGTIAFTVGDAQTAAGSLVITRSSSNTTLVPTANIVLGGSGASRTVAVKPATNQNGSATITIKVSDGTLTASRSFVLTVSAVNDAPTISSIGNVTIERAGVAGPIAFVVGDAETATGSLTLSGTSSNATLVPNANVTFGGSGANRTVKVVPVVTQSGTTTITVRVGDGTTSTTRAFVVTVTFASQILTSSDIGSPALAGSTTASNGTIQIRAAGTNIWGQTDQFRFARQTLQGDAELTVRLSSLVLTNAWARAGLMFRASPAADAAHVSVFVTPSSGVVLQWRARTAATSEKSTALPGSAPEWLRLLRTGDTFYAFCSANGIDWQLVESVQVDLPDIAYGGLAVTSKNTQAVTTATFDSFLVD